MYYSGVVVGRKFENISKRRKTDDPGEENNKKDRPKVHLSPF